MSDMKEMLELHIKNDIDLLPKNQKTVLDYITNLQQENERLKQPKIFIDTQDMEKRYGEELYKDYLEKQVNDYKSRIEKAVEYIKNNDNFWVALGEDCGKPNDDLEKLLNILNGRSDE